MPYLTPAQPITYVPGLGPKKRMRGLHGLGRLGITIKSPLPTAPPLRAINPTTGQPVTIPPSRFVPPTTSTPAATAPAAPVNPQAQSGYCVFTSSPETGGIVSVEQCSAGPGGVPINTGSGGNPYATNTVATPVPPTWPTNQPYTDSSGNVWVNIDGQWEITNNVASALPIYNQPAGPTPIAPIGPFGAIYDASIGATPPPPNWPISEPYIDPNGTEWIHTASGWVASGAQYATEYGATGTSTPPPATWPTNQPYTDTNGNVWTYSPATGWQVTSNAYGAGALAATGVSVVPANWPTNQPYTDASGNVWVYTGTGWQISTYGTGTSPYTTAAAEQAAMSAQAYGGYGAPAAAPATAAAAGGGYQSILDWLSEETLISGLPNWGILAAAGVVFMMLNKRK